MFYYDELVSFYDQNYRRMLMEQYSGRQKAYEEAVLSSPLEMLP